MKRKIEGNGNSLQEAIDDATGKGLQIPSGQTDVMFSWKLLDVQGLRGGIAGLNTFTVTIEADLPDRKKAPAQTKNTPKVKRK